jgi:hypothetical protein
MCHMCCDQLMPYANSCKPGLDIDSNGDDGDDDDDDVVVVIVVVVGKASCDPMYNGIGCSAEVDASCGTNTGVGVMV